VNVCFWRKADAWSRNERLHLDAVGAKSDPAWQRRTPTAVEGEAP